MTVLEQGKSKGRLGKVVRELSNQDSVPPLRFSEGPDPVNLDFLGDKLVEYGILSREKDLVEDLVELQDLEMVEFDSSHRGGTYRLTVPLFAQWVAAKDFAVSTERDFRPSPHAPNSSKFS